VALLRDQAIDASHSWVAVQGTDLGTIQAALGLEAFGVERLANDVPDVGIAELPKGWLVVVAADPAGAFRDPLAKITAFGRSVACCEDASRVETRNYEGGVETWRVVADRDDPEILSIVGDPPDEFSALLDMACYDIFYETPRGVVIEAYRGAVLDLALVMCGFQLFTHPEGLGWTELRPNG
jgi:hypothetical protein